MKQSGEGYDKRGKVADSRDTVDKLLKMKTEYDYISNTATKKKRASENVF